MPPATTTSVSPVAMPCAASITAFRPEPQTLLIMSAPTLGGRPARMAACRAGAWPTPAERTLPMMTSSTWSGARPARATASFTTIAPSCGAVKPLRLPRNLPVGVRTAERMTASRMVVLRGRRVAAREVARGHLQERAAQLGIGDGLGFADQRRRGRGLGASPWGSGGALAPGFTPGACRPDLLLEAEAVGRGAARHPGQTAQDLRAHPVQHLAPARVRHAHPQRAALQRQHLGAAREVLAHRQRPGRADQFEPLRRARREEPAREVLQVRLLQRHPRNNTTFGYTPLFGAARLPPGAESRTEGWFASA